MTNEIISPVAAEALAQYRPTDAAIAEMRSAYMPIRVSGVDDRAGASKAHDARMVVKNHRVAIEKTRVGLKADALAFGRAVDNEARRLTAMLEPIEAHLLEQEEIVTKEAERRHLAEEAKRAEILRGRMSALAAVRSPLIEADVARMSDEQYQAALDAAAAAYAAALEAERAASEQRRMESERLAAERAELDRLRAEQDKAAAEQRMALERERAAQEAEARKIAADRAAIEAEKAAAARAAEIRAAEERAEAERVRRESMRPTVEKLHALAAQVETMPVPDFTGAHEVRGALVAAATAIRAIAGR